MSWLRDGGSDASGHCDNRSDGSRDDPWRQVAGLKVSQAGGHRLDGAIGAEDYEKSVRFNGQPLAGMAVKMTVGANALETADTVRQAVAEMSPSFPPGVEVVYPYDTTPFVRLSIENVIIALGEAIVLVFLVMYLFLQNFRATLIPTIAVPIVLLGTFGMLAALGYSINNLTLMALTISTGFVVDDAIVMIENIVRHLEDGETPLAAEIDGIARRLLWASLGVVALVFAAGLLRRLPATELLLTAVSLAVAAVQANLDSVASPDLVALAAQLAALVAPYVSKS